MKPALAHHLVRIFSEPGQVVVDPFSGSGTIPFEAALADRIAIGLDLGRLSAIISNAKLRPADPSEAKRWLTRLGKWISDYSISDDELRGAASIAFNKSIPEYFHPRTLNEILAARRFFATQADGSPASNLLFAATLHILHGNRPYALSRRSHPLTPYAPSGEAEYRPLIGRLASKVERSLNVEYPPQFRAGRCYLTDALDPWPAAIRNVDLMLTSPPFFDSTRFYLANWMRYWFAGWEGADFAGQPSAFVEERQKEDFKVYRLLLERFAERMSANALVVLHLGYSKKCDMAAAIANILPDSFSILDVYAEDVGHCETHGIRDKGTVTDHQYMILRAT